MFFKCLFSVYSLDHSTVLKVTTLNISRAYYVGSFVLVKFRDETLKKITIQNGVVVEVNYLISSYLFNFSIHFHI